MKLQDLFEQKAYRRKMILGNIPLIQAKRPIRIKGVDNPVIGDDGMGPSMDDHLGSGVQASAFSFPKQTNTIVKYSTIWTDTPEHESAVKVVSLILKHQDNPFFPRIHKAKIVSFYDPRRKDTKFMLVVQMERLHSMKGDKIKHIIPQLFANIGLDLEKHNLTVAKLGTIFSNPRFIKGLVQRSNNPQFKEAMQTLQPLINRHDSDMHQDNWMVRLTGSGPQLVIIDPIAPSF